MAKNFKELRQALSPEAQEKAAVLAKKLRAEMPLHELRQAHGLSQATIADILDVRQPSVANMEKNVDMYISTLRKYIAAMGGTLNIIAEFPEGEVKIRNFTDIDHVNVRSGKMVKLRQGVIKRRVSDSAITTAKVISSSVRSHRKAFITAK